MMNGEKYPHPRTTLVAACLALGVAAVGCKDDDAGLVVADAGLVTSELPACGDDPTEPCVDSMGLEICPADSGWDGDGLRPCEPKPGEGMLLHYGPADYDDEDEIAKYTLEANGEVEDCIYVEAPNDAEVYIGKYHGRMRPYSHHLIVTLVDSLDGVPLNTPVPCSQTGAVGSRWLLGAQDPQIDLTRGGGAIEDGEPKEGDPDYKLGTRLPARQYLRINMHYINPTDAPILRESWVYLETVPKSDVQTPVDMITFFQGSINVAPGATGVQTAIAKCTAPSDRYVGLVTGHFHENGTRFSMWHDKADGESELIYETYDWENPGNAFYSNRTKNPKVDGKGGGWGAKSGYLHVKKGESISFQCEFDNPTDTRVRLGELGRDQMCNVFGMYYPSDGDVWNCVCLGTACFDEIPSGLQF